EVAERLDRLRVVADAANEPVDAIGIRPICLDIDGVEALLGDESLGDLRAVAVELVRAVRRLADQDEMRVADEREQVVVVAARPGQFVKSELGHCSRGRSSLCCRIWRSALGQPISAVSSSHAKTMAGGTPTECSS